MEPALTAGMLFTAVLAHPAVANDSVATLGAGGIILVYAGAITMEKEDLFIAKDEVRVN